MWSWFLAYGAALVIAGIVGFFLRERIAEAWSREDQWNFGAGLQYGNDGPPLNLPPVKFMLLTLGGLVAGVGTVFVAALFMGGYASTEPAPEPAPEQKVEVLGTSAVERNITILYPLKVPIRHEAAFKVSVADAGDAAKRQRVWFLRSSLDLKKRAQEKCAAETDPPDTVYSCSPPNGDRTDLVWYVSADNPGVYKVTIGPKDARAFNGQLLVNGKQAGTDSAGKPAAELHQATGSVTMPLTILTASGLPQLEHTWLTYAAYVAAALLATSAWQLLPGSGGSRRPRKTGKAKA